MVFFEWHEIYLTNVSRLDAHHQKLVSLINDLYISTLNEQDLSLKQPLIEKALAELVDFSHYHFAAEEKLMLKYDYPDYIPHKEGHDYFKSEVEEMMKRHKDGDFAGTLPLLDYLKAWLSLHVINADKQYAPFFDGKNINGC